MQCPCGSGKTYAACCEPYIRGVKNAPDPEALMRSRYSAYVKHAIDYIERTHSLERRDALDIEETRKWAEESEWLGLEILASAGGGASDSEGTVEFVARFSQNGEEFAHHEISTFRRVAGKWFFFEGHTPSRTVVRENPKVGRNDPCPCGSGKKFKQCCGR